MAIRRYLENPSVFSPEDTQEMTRALEEVCQALRIDEGATRARDAVAVRIVELARDGERKAEWLQDRLLRELGALAATLGNLSGREGQVGTPPVNPEGNPADFAAVATNAHLGISTNEADRPEHWRKRAEEIRAMAVGESPEASGALLKIAADFDELARRGEERVRETLKE